MLCKPTSTGIQMLETMETKGIKVTSVDLNKARTMGMEEPGPSSQNTNLTQQSATIVRLVESLATSGEVKRVITEEHL